MLMLEWPISVRYIRRSSAMKGRSTLMSGSLTIDMGTQRAPDADVTDLLPFNFAKLPAAARNLA
jgi:hypothetical protein